MTRYLLLSIAFMLCSTLAVAQTSLLGKVTESETGEPVLFGTVALYKNDVPITGVETDFDGNYSFSNIDPGTYDVEAQYVGLQTQRIAGVVVLAGKANTLDIQLGTGGITLEEVVVVDYKVPLIEKDNTTSGAVVTGEQIRTLPTKSINGLAASTAGVGSADDGDDLSMRGSRTGATDYYIDGIRVRGNMIPQSEIDQMQVITGGIEAQYGDVVGGIISITTKGPSSKFSGGLEAETSEFLDSYGYNLLSANVSGPILKKENGQSILGFRLSGQYRYRLDDDPPALPIYRVKEDVLAELEANPIRQISTGFVPAAEFLTNEDVDVLDYRPDQERSQLDFTAKLDARLSDQIDVTFTGSYNQVANKFTPGYAAARPSTQVGNGLGTWTTLNSHNNPTDNSSIYRGNFRFRHRLGGGSASDGTTTEGEGAKGSVIQNASYVLQAGYERSQSNLADPTHGDNLFDYGYIGKFDYEWTPITGQSEWGGAFPIPGLGNIAHADYRQEFTGYTPSDINPILANYNNLIADTDNDNDFLTINGDYIGPVRTAWNLHENVGTVYNVFNKDDNDYYTFNVNSSFELVPGGDANKGRHSVQFGILYEQRFLREYDMDPRELWILARLQQNRHLSGVDTTNVIGTFTDTDGNPNLQGLEFNQFAPQNNADDFEGNYFFQRARELNGTPVDQFFNVDAIDPSQLSLDMFSAQELNDYNDINLNYYGYDYQGNRLGNEVVFDDFFTVTDPNGVRTHPVAAFQPIYAAAFVQDKFTFKDIIFRLGLRVDRYDANTKVLKDPFSLYDVMSASDFYSGPGSDEERPATVGDDFKIYVNGDSESSTDVRAFRDGENWHFADGTLANGGNVIFGSEVVNPRYYENNVNNIRDRDFDPNVSFKDYEPQINWAPRLAFSFPISDDANFFAHYDVLVQRPSSLQARATALQYFYMEERNSTNSVLFENSNLRPQRTIDYEVGFQQKLSNSSAIKIAAYYKELRDMIQRRIYNYVATPIGTYLTYDNQDFGTVKGFTFQYDLRRTNNVQMTANYALQFADGTGSDADSQRGTAARGNLRTLFPFSYDERHSFNVIIDYRYAAGKQYNGPSLFGKDVFANAGVNIQTSAVSGRPYTAKIQPTVLAGAGTIGSINGARKPWTFRIDLRVDKSFRLARPDSKNGLDLNVYFRVQNLLDARNVINVYEASGSPTDDGFLTSANGQESLQQVINANDRNVQAYLDAYQWREVNPTFYSLPRRMYVGAIIEF